MNKKASLSTALVKRFPFLIKKSKRTHTIVIDKRKKFVIAVFFLSFLLFFTELRFGKEGIIVAFILAILSIFFLLWAVYKDLKENFTLMIFLLPFFYSLAFGLFYFLVPSRFISRIILTMLYAFGLYSLFLSQNIFTVASIRTIQLLSGARIVSFIITLISFFFLTNIVFTLHTFLYIILPLMTIYAFPLIHHSLWTYNLQESAPTLKLWSLFLTIILLEVAAVIWFWPTSPTIISLFLTGIFYTIVGLSHVWFERRLFKNVLWEYLWVSVFTFFVLLLFTQWGK